MMTLLRYFCLVVCFVASRIEGRGTWNALGNYEYYASPLLTFASYDDGLKFCQDNFGELALIKNQDTQNFLDQLVTDEGSFPYAFFIGLRKQEGAFVWEDGESLSYENWMEHEPSKGAEEFCVIAGSTPYAYSAELKWDDVTCGTGAQGYFCQRLIGKNWAEWGEWSNCVCPGQQQRTRNCTATGRTGPDSCTISGESATEDTTCWLAECDVTTPALTTTERPLGRGDWFAHGNFQYYVSAKSAGVSYTESQEYCNEEDGELALVKSSDVQTFIASLVPSDSGVPYAFYIGLRYDVASGDFLWSDGTPLEYKNWKTGEPNRDVYVGEDCVGIGGKYTYEPGLPWHDYQCVSDGGHGKKGLVCQRRIGTYWSPWSEWGGCSCAITNHSRNRSCVDSGRPGPDDCLGAANETQQCAYEPSCHTTTVAETTTAYPTTTIEEATTKQEERTSGTTIATEKPTTVESATTIVAEATTTMALVDTTTVGEETTIAAVLTTAAMTEETTTVLAETTTIAEETTRAAAVETTTTMAKEATTALAETTTAAEVTAEPVVVVITAMTEDNATSTGQAPTTMETSTVLAETTTFAEVTTAAAAVETTTVAGVTTSAAAVETTTVTEVTTAAAAVDTTTMTEGTTTITEKITTTPAATVAVDTTAATVGDTSGSGATPLATTELQETLTSTEIVKQETTTPQTPETTPAPTTARFEVTESTTNGGSGMETTLSSKTTTTTSASSTASYTIANSPISTTNPRVPGVVTTAETPPNATEEAGVPISAATSPPLSTTKMDGQVHTSVPESPATTKIVGVSPTAAPQNSIVGPIVGAIGGCLLLAIIFVIIIFKKHQTNRTGRMKVSTAPQLEMGRRGSDRQSLTHDNRHGVVMNWGDGIDGIWYGQEGVGNSTFAYQEEANNAKFGDETEPFRADDEPGPSEVTYAVINKNSSTMDSKQEDEDAENSISRHIEVNGDPYAVVDRTKKDTQPSESIENNDDTDAGQSEVTYAVVNKDRSAVDSKQEEQDHIEVNGDPYAVVDRTKKDIKPSESVDHIDANGDTYAVVNKSASTSPELQGKDDADPYSVI